MVYSSALITVGPHRTTQTLRHTHTQSVSSLLYSRGVQTLEDAEDVREPEGPVVQGKEGLMKSLRLETSEKQRGEVPAGSVDHCRSHLLNDSADRLVFNRLLQRAYSSNAYIIRRYRQLYLGTWQI